jgi:PAS domain S-box-containing protein
LQRWYALLFIHPADQTALRVSQRELGREELTLRAEDESTMPVYFSINSLQLSQSQKAFCIVVTDLTEQKRREEIVAAEKLARSIIEQATEAIAVCDESRKIIRFSNALSKILDQNPSLQRFEDLFDMRLPTGNKLSPVSAALQGEVLQQVEASLERSDGMLFHLLLNAGPLKSADGRIMGCVVTLTDITERKRTEEELRKSEARFRSVLENSRDVIYRLNIQTGRFEYISPSVETVVGFSSEELMAEDIETSLAMINPDDMPAIRAMIAHLEEAGRGELEYRQRTKTGDYRWISNQISIIKDNAGRPLYRSGNIRDITERKLAEEALRESEERLKLLFESANDGIVHCIM